MWPKVSNTKCVRYVRTTCVSLETYKYPLTPYASCSIHVTVYIIYMVFKKLFKRRIRLLETSWSSVFLMCFYSQKNNIKCFSRVHNTHLIYKKIEKGIVQSFCIVNGIVEVFSVVYSRLSCFILQFSHCREVCDRLTHLKICEHWDFISYTTNWTTMLEWIFSADFCYSRAMSYMYVYVRCMHLSSA